jgi:nicotinate-nucleotide pyrophosphorylase (carboxylating)
VLSFTPALEAQLRGWLDEDLGRGDLTAPALVGRTGRAHWVTRADGVFCGGVLVAPLLAILDPRASVRLLVADGEPVVAGQRLLELEGPAAALVAAERTALNLAMRLSGIASATAALVQVLAGTGVRLADTRKTTPGLRVLETYAVRCGVATVVSTPLTSSAATSLLQLATASGESSSTLAAAGFVSTQAASTTTGPWPGRWVCRAAAARWLRRPELTPRVRHRALTR